LTTVVVNATDWTMIRWTNFENRTIFG